MYYIWTHSDFVELKNILGLLLWLCDYSTITAAKQMKSVTTTKDFWVYIYKYIYVYICVYIKNEMVHGHLGSNQRYLSQVINRDWDKLLVSLYCYQKWDSASKFPEFSHHLPNTIHFLKSVDSVIGHIFTMFVKTIDISIVLAYKQKFLLLLAPFFEKLYIYCWHHFSIIKY